MTRLIDSTPRADGFRMPGEFEPHEQLWMLWPQRPDNWRLGGKPAQRAWVEVAIGHLPVRAGHRRREPRPVRERRQPASRLRRASSRSRATTPGCATVGPTFVVNDSGEVRLVDWDFNAWGGLYDGARTSPGRRTELVPQKLAQLEGVDRYKAPLVMEGGSFHADGEGTVITTEECLLSPGRNPDLSREEIEAEPRATIWASRRSSGWQGASTPRRPTATSTTSPASARPGVVLAAVTDDRADWRYELLCRTTCGASSEATDARDRRLEVHTVPMPAIMEITEEEAWGVDSAEGSIPRRPGDKTAASYLNFLIVNGGIILPAFDDPNDEVAREIIAGVFPDERS